MSAEHVLDNPSPKVYQPEAQHREPEATVSEDDEREAFDALEIFDLIRTIKACPPPPLQPCRVDDLLIRQGGLFLQPLLGTCKRMDSLGLPPSFLLEGSACQRLLAPNDQMAKL